MTSTDERIGVLEAQVAVLLSATREQAELLRQHMLREEITTRELLAQLARVEKRLSTWHGVAAGAGLVVSAVWAAALAAVAWFDR